MVCDVRSLIIVDRLLEFAHVWPDQFDSLKQISFKLKQSCFYCFYGISTTSGGLFSVACQKKKKKVLCFCFILLTSWKVALEWFLNASWWSIFWFVICFYHYLIILSMIITGGVEEGAFICQWIALFLLRDSSANTCIGFAQSIFLFFIISVFFALLIFVYPKGMLFCCKYWLLAPGRRYLVFAFVSRARASFH